jgi:hypothetical protein
MSFRTRFVGGSSSRDPDPKAPTECFGCTFGNERFLDLMDWLPHSTRVRGQVDGPESERTPLRVLQSEVMQFTCSSSTKRRLRGPPQASGQILHRTLRCAMVGNCLKEGQDRRNDQRDHDDLTKVLADAGLATTADIRGVFSQNTSALCAFRSEPTGRPPRQVTLRKCANGSLIRGRILDVTPDPMVLSKRITLIDHNSAWYMAHST